MRQVAAGLAAAGLAFPAAAQPARLAPPVSPACISSPFGMRHAVGPHAPAAFHNGVDLPAPAGALVHAAAAGTVVAIRRQGLGGVTVHLAQGGGMTTLYAHLGNLVPAIAEGRRAVAAGEPLGHVARTGVTYGTHVFFAVLLDGVAVDPLRYMDVPPCGRVSPGSPAPGGTAAGSGSPPPGSATSPGAAAPRAGGAR